MKTGRTLTEIAKELERQVESKKDYLADSRNLSISEQGNRLILSGNGELEVTDLAHRQIAGRLGIPAKYYDIMRAEAPALLATNVNHWLHSDPEKRLIRTLDGRARAFLSDRYRPLDNYDLAEAVLPKIQAMGCSVQSAEITETRLYFKVVTEKITAKIKGDVVQAGLVISNSEVGCGSVRVEPLIFTLACLNGMIAENYALRKYHVGRGAGDIEGEDAVEFYKDSTRELSDKAFWAKVRDTVEATLTQAKFELIVNKMRESAERAIEGNPVKVVEVLSKRLGFAENEQSGVLKHLIKGGDLSQYGLLNAVTRAAQDVESYDRSTEMERMGGGILELPKRDWEAIAAAN